MYYCCAVLSHVQLFAAPWSAAHQAPLSMGFPRQEYRSGLALSYQEDLPDPGIKPMSLPLAGRFFTTEPPGNSAFGNRIVVIPLVILAGEN